MSEQVLETGKLVDTGKSLSEFLTYAFNNELIGSNYHNYSLGDLTDMSKDNMYELFMDNFYDEYVLYGSKVYEVIDYKSHDTFDLFNSTLNEDGSYSFTLSYYNGGCGFSEAIEYALVDCNKEVK